MNYFLAKTLIALVLLSSLDVAMAQTTTLNNDSIKESTSPRILTNKKVKKESPTKRSKPRALKPPQYRSINTFAIPIFSPTTTLFEWLNFGQLGALLAAPLSLKSLSFKKKYVNNNVVFLGISNEDDNTVSSFVSYMGGQMVYAIGLDESRATSRAFSEISGASTIPHAYILSPDNKILWDGNPASGSFEIALREAITHRDLDS
jgi:hypothetical protein